MTKASIRASDEAWDDETLGADANYMKVADDALESAVDEASGTQLISIRLQKSMVESFKAIAAANKGIGYQTLMKQILQRFIESEMKRVWNEHIAEKMATYRAEAEKAASSKNQDKRKVA
jgi:uncharacterized protein (DUF4415 family)